MRCVLTRCDDLRGEVGCYEVVVQRVDVVATPSAFVPQPDIVDVQPVHVARARQPLRDVHRSGVGERAGAALRHPCGKAPAQRVQLNGRVAALGLAHQPPLVAPVVVLLVLHVHMRRLRALRRLCVTADLDLEDLQGGAEAGQEEVVEDLPYVWVLVRRQQAGGRASAGQTADAIEHEAEVDRGHGVQPGGGGSGAV